MRAPCFLRFATISVREACDKPRQHRLAAQPEIPARPAEGYRARQTPLIVENYYS